MKDTHQITEEVTWLEDMDTDQIRSIHQCMKDYTEEVLDTAVKEIGIQTVHTSDDRFISIEKWLHEFKSELI